MFQLLDFPDIVLLPISLSQLTQSWLSSYGCRADSLAVAMRRNFHCDMTISVIHTHGNMNAWLNATECFQSSQSFIHRWQDYIAPSNRRHKAYPVMDGNAHREDEKQTRWRSLTSRHRGFVVSSQQFVSISFNVIFRKNRKKCHKDAFKIQSFGSYCQVNVSEIQIYLPFLPFGRIVYWMYLVWTAE
jgi:hypothetical protein